MRDLRALSTCIGFHKASLLLFFLRWLMGSWFFTRNYFCTKSCGFSIQMKPLRQNFCIVLLICDASILSWRFTMAHGTLDMLDAIVTFQGEADLEPTHRRHRPPSSLDFLRLKHAQAVHEQTEQPTTQIRSVSFVDATNAIQWALKNSPKS